MANSLQMLNSSRNKQPPVLSLHRPGHVPSLRERAQLCSAPEQVGPSLHCCSLTTCHPVTYLAAQLHQSHTFSADKADRSAVSRTDNVMADKPEDKPQKTSKR